MSKKYLGALVVLLILVIGFYYQSQIGGDDNKVKKVGFIYVGPVTDFGWTYEHDQGRKAVVERFGENVETTYVESVEEGADAERAITQMARDHDLIFTTSFGYMNPTSKVAKNFDKVKFEHATGYQRSDNVANYAARFYEGRHLIGLIAGGMTQTNKIGYIASFPIPEVIRGINAAYFDATDDIDVDTSFAGVALYPQLSTSEKFSLGLRAEYFVETEGGVNAIGAYDFKGDADVFAVTLTGNYSVGNLMIKPELRLDSACEDATFMDNNLNPSNSLSSFVLAAVYSF